MGEFERILVAVAFTPQVQGLLDRAAAVAGKLGAQELIVANVINSRDVDAVSTITALGYNVDGENYVKSVKADRREILNDYLNKIAFPSEKIRVLIKVGDPVDELLKISVKEQIDLFVMGTKGRTNLEYVLVGSVAEKIFRRSPVPILSYRSKEHAERLRKNIRVS